jgi:hypothetical protein
MYSIILTHEANNANSFVHLKAALSKFGIADVIDLNPQPYYSGVIFQNRPSDSQVNQIREYIRKQSSQSCIHFKDGVPPNPSALEPKPFDFEDYDDTSISGPGMEMDIDKLINETSKTLRTSIDNKVTRRQAVGSIAELWIQKIQEWVELNKD